MSEKQQSTAGCPPSQRSLQDVLPPPASSHPRRTASRAKRATLAIVVVLLLYHASQLCIGLPLLHHQKHVSKRTNVILMISDGYGPASETFGRSFHQAIANNTRPDAHYRTPLDKLLVGSHRSRSSDSLITDSAAGATAFSCGVKSYNGAIGVDADGELCATVFEGAKEKGMLTGVVVTSRLTDATPACFIAHVPSRAQESEIANQALGLSSNGSEMSGGAPLDLAIGGGGCYFLPSTHPLSCRADEVDLVAHAKQRGWSTRVLFDSQTEVSAAGLPTLSVHHGGRQQDGAGESTAVHAFMKEHHQLPLLALLAPFNTPYEIDRQSHQPTLSSLAMKALETLDQSEKNERGFLVMIEGSQIDLCAHQNDPACHAREIEAYQQAIKDVARWVEKKNKAGERTILISTSDHETGGLTLARQLGPKYPNYAYYPERLIGVQQSAAALSSRLLAFARTAPLPSAEQVKAYIHDAILVQGAAFTPNNGGPPSLADVERMFSCLRKTPGAQVDTAADPPIDTADDCRKVVADLISRRAEVGWSTSGHSGVDVPVHVLGSSGLKGNIENTEIGTFIAETLAIDLASLTHKLKKARGRAV